DRIAAIFIGGSTEWKESAAALAVAKAARARGKFVHWGRMNTRRRFDLIVKGGVADSFDGSKWARFRKTYLDQGLSWRLETRHPLPPAPAPQTDAELLEEPYLETAEYGPARERWLDELEEIEREAALAASA